jgi:hypothetical protein
VEVFCNSMGKRRCLPEPQEEGAVSNHARRKPEKKPGLHSPGFAFSVYRPSWASSTNGGSWEIMLSMSSNMALLVVPRLLARLMWVMTS